MRDRLPRTDGDDDAYLAAALTRAGRAAPRVPVSVEALTGGRTGARVDRLDAGGRCFVRKRVPATSWRHGGTGRADSGEPALWMHGAVRALGPRLRWPVLDLAWDRRDDAYLILMDDVGAGIRGRGAFSRADSHALFEALADLHARFHLGAGLEIAPVPDVAATTRLFTTPLLHLVGGRVPEEPWVTAMLDDFQVMRRYAPMFLELLGPARADDYLALCADGGWSGRLANHPGTLLHGDTRRANIAFEEGGVALFDWELASIGPAACDLQWHCLLHYWAYPPDGVAPGDPCDDLRDHYVAALEARLGQAIDRVAFTDSWNLGWVRTMASVGYVLADGATADVARRAVERACATVDR
jgi:hypothetical protein